MTISLQKTEGGYLHSHLCSLREVAGCSLQLSAAKNITDAIKAFGQNQTDTAQRERHKGHQELSVQDVCDVQGFKYTVRTEFLIEAEY